MPKTIQNDLPFVLHDVARLMRTRFDQYARQFGMTRAQCVTLMKLECRPGMSQTELAAILEVEPITVARLIDRLEASGFVERRPDPSDRRMHRLHLLPAATPLIAEIDKYRAMAVAKLREVVDPADWEAAHRVLLQFKETLLTEGFGAPEGDQS
ncbi:DNA-binding MarR family transcriptional regulator [Rhizomicrobium palustre]|uniref:DNA-binding MarR family transcriptional regulator n=1 Tax=Rhizomicrobium palustre TaxID=189966 RepID=A0A846N2C7_9PROT|nr:MarR family transcriptional regulator [Rhizomicrobium palustre]NIK89763.1 DNA-binding MarR family transcriptional regulator [Rhizomicrobium palustre]